jgi:hypothetical protein
MVEAVRKMISRWDFVMTSRLRAADGLCWPSNFVMTIDIRDSVCD